MSARVRMTLLAIVVVGVVIAIVSLTADDPVIDGPGPGGEKLIDLTNESCRECHPAVYAEWEASYHRQSTTMPYVLLLSDDFRDTSCLPCHRPAPIFDGKYGRIPAKRLDRHEDGVDCLTCHKLPEGGMAAVRDGLTGACRPTVKELDGANMLTSVEHCAGCHNQHWTIDNWRLSEYGPEKAGAEALDCMDCHMETVRREGPNGSYVGRDHSFPGSHDLATLQSAVEVTATIENGEVVVATKNVGAGHHIPTDARHRSFNVMVRVEDEHGNVRVNWEEIDEYRLYYREEGGHSTQIPSGETATARRGLPARVAKGRVIVRLYYCLIPKLAIDLRNRRFDDPNLQLVEERIVPFG